MSAGGSSPYSGAAVPEARLVSVSLLCPCRSVAGCGHAVPVHGQAMAFADAAALPAFVADYAVIIISMGGGSSGAQGKSVM